MPERGDIVADRFEIEEELGDGGMGAVYKVHDRKRDATGALKLPHARLLRRDPKVRERFVREARATGSVDSDHVVKVIDFDDSPEGTPWMLMEYLEGETLRARVDRDGPLALDDARRFALQLGHGLGAAHAKGVVHMDLKPENVFLAKSARVGGRELLKVVDFGLSRVIEQHRTRASNTSGLGTLAWSAPEQYDSDKVPRSVDVWPLGLIAFWMLTGKQYWLSQNTDAANRETALVREVLIDPIVSATERAEALGVRERVPAGFDAWFARCVDRDPRERFQDAAVATEALEAILRVELASPTAAPSTQPPSGSSPRAPWARRALVALVALSAAVGITVALRAPSRPPPRPPAPRPSPRWTPPPDAPAPLGCPPGMKLVPAGRAALGGEAPRSVEVPAYCVDEFEVAVRDYQRCVDDGGANGCAPANEAWWPGATGSQRARHAQLCASERDRERPVACVSWDMARAYCRHRGEGFDLPTSAQWEVAARGRDGRRYPWGNEEPAPERLNGCGTECFAFWRRRATASRAEVLYLADDGAPNAVDVRRFEGDVSPFGVRGLGGNVQEWTLSCARDDLATSPRDLRCEADAQPQRLVRGGGWNSVAERDVRATAQVLLHPATQMADLGFRCAASAR